MVVNPSHKFVVASGFLFIISIPLDFNLPANVFNKPLISAFIETSLALLEVIKPLPTPALWQSVVLQPLKFPLALNE